VIYDYRRKGGLPLEKKRLTRDEPRPRNTAPSGNGPVAITQKPCALPAEQAARLAHSICHRLLKIVSGWAAERTPVRNCDHIANALHIHPKMIGGSRR
jgi:hypothetical protein